jgi:hypothetical protein
MCRFHSLTASTTQDYISRVSQAVMASNPGMEVEVVVSSEGMTPDHIANEIASASEGSEHRVGAEFSFIKSPFVSSACSPSTLAVESRPILVCVHGFVVEGIPTSRATVRLPIGDDRAKRLLDGERDHFSRDQANLLIFNISRVVSDIDAWSKLVARCFQPTQNRRIGAVILYSTALMGGYERIWQRWRVVPNPFATTPLEPSLLTAIGKLDDGPYPGMAANDLEAAS